MKVTITATFELDDRAVEAWRSTYGPDDNVGDDVREYFANHIYQAPCTDEVPSMKITVE